MLIESGQTVDWAGNGVGGLDPFLDTHMYSGQSAGAYMQTFTVGTSGNLSTLTWDYAFENPTPNTYEARVTFEAYNLGPNGYTGQSLVPGSPDVVWSFDLTGGYPLPIQIRPPAGTIGSGRVESSGSGPPNLGVVTAGDVIAVVMHASFADPAAVPADVRFGRPYGTASELAPYADGQAHRIAADGTVIPMPDPHLLGELGDLRREREQEAHSDVTAHDGAGTGHSRLALPGRGVRRSFHLRSAPWAEGVTGFRRAVGVRSPCDGVRTPTAFAPSGRRRPDVGAHSARGGAAHNHQPRWRTVPYGGALALGVERNRFTGGVCSVGATKVSGALRTLRRRAARRVWAPPRRRWRTTARPTRRDRALAYSPSSYRAA